MSQISEISALSYNNFIVIESVPSWHLVETAGAMVPKFWAVRKFFWFKNGKYKPQLFGKFTGKVELDTCSVYQKIATAVLLTFLTNYTTGDRTCNITITISN